MQPRANKYDILGRQEFNSLRSSDYIYVSKLTIIGSDNGLSPGRHQTIIWTNAGILLIIGIDTKIKVIVASPTTWEAHHSPRAKPEGCGELPRSLVTQQWPKWRYQFLFYHDETKSITNKQKNAR